MPRTKKNLDTNEAPRQVKKKNSPKTNVIELKSDLIAKTAREEKIEEMSWSFPEYQQHERSDNWYKIFGATIIILIAYSLWVKNFSFIFLILICAIILILRQQESLTILTKLTHNGVHLGNTIYYYKDLKNFWIIYESSKIKTLYFRFKSLTKLDLIIPLADQNPVEVRAFLLQYMDEDLHQNHESLSEVLERVLKL